MAGRLKLIVLLVVAFTGIEAARIFAYFPSPSISHQVVFRPLTHELARRGHEVIVVTADPAYPKGKAPANLTEIDVHDISYDVWKKLFTYNEDKKGSVLTDIQQLIETHIKIFDLQMQVPEIKEIMKKDSKYFDLLLLESYHRPILAMAHKFDAPVIQVSSLGGDISNYDEMGAPSHPILYPIGLRVYNLTLIEKVYQFIEYKSGSFFSFGESADIIIKKHFGNDVPSYDKLKHSIKMIFFNEHPFWSDNRPVPPNIIYMGGIHKSPSKEISKELQEYLDSSKNGVIYVSFGTNVLASLLPPEKIKIMTKVMSELPYDVLWKWDQDVLPGQSQNIKISKWFPQSNLLKHPKIKLFITQAGLQSTDEAIDATVPLIGIPMLGDQWYNAEKYAHHKMGLHINMNSLNEKEFKEAVNTVINDISYKNNMIRIKGIMREYPIHPLNLTVWWAEHVIKYGGDHLKSPAAFMSWFEYYEVKLVSILFSILVAILILIIYILKLILGYLKRIYISNLKPKND